MDKIVCPCGKSYWPNQAWMHKACVTNITNSITNNETDRSIEGVRDSSKQVQESASMGSFVSIIAPPELQVAIERNSPSARVSAWREKNKEKYVAYQRELMRKRRADKKAAQ